MFILLFCCIAAVFKISVTCSAVGADLGANHAPPKAKAAAMIEPIAAATVAGTTM